MTLSTSLGARRIAANTIANFYSSLGCLLRAMTSPVVVSYIHNPTHISGSPVLLSPFNEYI